MHGDFIFSRLGTIGSRIGDIISWYLFYPPGPIFYSYNPFLSPETNLYIRISFFSDWAPKAPGWTTLSLVIYFILLDPFLIRLISVMLKKKFCIQFLYSVKNCMQNCIQYCIQLVSEGISHHIGVYPEQYCIQLVSEGMSYHIGAYPEPWREP